MIASCILICLLASIHTIKSSHSLILLNHLGNNYNGPDPYSIERDPDDYETEEDLLDLDIDEMMSNNMNNDYDHGCPGLDYLGVGYDSIYANSLGSDSSLLDPGYRAPIIEFDWRKNSEGYSPTLGSLHPIGGWVRPVFSCSRSTKINEISNLDEYKDSLSASAKLNGDIPQNSFTGSLDYKNSFSKFKSKNQKIYTKTEQCIRYQVGISLNLTWNYTESFKFSISKLPILDMKEIKYCNIRDKFNTSNEKCDSIKPWIKFFEMFGTHFNHQLTLGGKITQTMQFDASSLEELKKKGIDVELEIRTELGSGSVNITVDNKREKSELDDIGYKKMSVMGGQMPNFPLNDEEFANWAETVADNPMPIGVVATSLKRLIDPSLHTSYDEALHQYGILNGISYEQLKMIEKATNIVTWSKENKIKCPAGSKILTGISLVFGDGILLGVNSCKSKLNDCTIPTYEDVKYSYNWISCSFGLIPSIQQLVKKSNDKQAFVEIKCPNHAKIQMGLIVVTKEGKITSILECQHGERSCKYDIIDKELAYIWGVCYSYIEKINKIQLKLSITDLSSENIVSCSDGYKIVSGYVSIFPNGGVTKFDYPESCTKYASSCSFKHEKKSLAFILCKSLSV